MSEGFYTQLRKRRGDDSKLAHCIESVVTQLEKISTTGDRPGMLLGKIQSGKTRAFIGIIAHAFDKDFDIAIVLTKGTKTLSAQTVARLNESFKPFIVEDELMVIDIMKPPGKLITTELRRKLVIVAKKESANLRRLIQFIDKDYPQLKKRSVLIIDDEADLASVRFVRPRGTEIVEQGKIATKIDELRKLVSSVSFLQVTATPYSLYLQPDDYDESDFVFKPKKPAFTELLPIHSGYVGGDDYFLHKDATDPRSYLIVAVSQEEQDALRREDRRRIRATNVLETKLTTGLVRSIVTFIVGVIIRQWQQSEMKQKPKKYAMIIHNDTQKAAHLWQDQVLNWVFDGIVEAATKSPRTLSVIFDETFDDLSKSITAHGTKMPDKKSIFASFITVLKGDEVVRETVNSDNDVLALLDENAELKLRTSFNIFVGGNILDRGITVPNLISFYYGRNPKTMQADTVLQHSRMYGNRDRNDLAITRFYTSTTVSNRLYTINTFENALREAFETGAHERGVVFIQSDSKGRVRPCAPNKVLLSNVVAVKPTGLYLPTDFDTIAATSLKKITQKLDGLISIADRDKGKFFEIDKETAIKILDLIEETMEFSTSDFEWDAMRGLLDYYCSISGSDKILCLAETGRQLDKKSSGDKSGLSIIGGTGIRKLVQASTRDIPALILLQQTGEKSLNWSGAPFWWPVLAAPANVEPCVFATKVSST